MTPRAPHREKPAVVLGKAYALFPQPSGAPKVVRVEILERYDVLSGAMVREEWNKKIIHVLPFDRLASEKTLAAKTAILTAPNPDRSEHNVAGMTDTGALTQPETATA
ncbi:hypothetical protein OH491_21855 [Termitidicoccus mucosus]|uniref:Uncharacterized protein n=1 Tax=Termitidicoccus mucosus TaxID=1184151 RepID=A0A178ICD3_9BACT|nr:hypothetical protein AW736_21870 [Opitutaceae bacterium TSB47]